MRKQILECKYRRIYERTAHICIQTSDSAHRSAHPVPGSRDHGSDHSGRGAGPEFFHPANNGDRGKRGPRGPPARRGIRATGGPSRAVARLPAYGVTAPLSRGRLAGAAGGGGPRPRVGRAYGAGPGRAVALSEGWLERALERELPRSGPAGTRLPAAPVAAGQAGSAGRGTSMALWRRAVVASVLLRGEQTSKTMQRKRFDPNPGH
ncbi:PREDICTED: collagen alpha-2(I) chain-like [Calidris pugnax]|uniref:collagen alpha-2(I) chain-like n=1 Tax=Calidris pugnax TaxID=198806 RepID=UPI00071CDBA0|nr:PREDICTED: collagen alpha-2(I) chain-like [Calidris pugnax]